MDIIVLINNILICITYRKHDKFSGHQISITNLKQLYINDYLHSLLLTTMFSRFYVLCFFLFLI